MHLTEYIEYLYPDSLLVYCVCVCMYMQFAVLTRSVHWDEGMLLDRNVTYIPVGELLCLAALGVERLH